MQERTTRRMEEFFLKPLVEIRAKPYVGDDDSKEVGIAKALKFYLNNYHSDFRWKIKYYYAPAKTIPI